MPHLTLAQFTTLFPWFGQGSAETVCQEGFEIFPGDPYKAQQHQLNTIVATLLRNNRYYADDEIRHGSKSILTAPAAEQIPYLKALLIRNLFCATQLPYYFGRQKPAWHAIDCVPPRLVRLRNRLPVRPTRHSG